MRKERLYLGISKPKLNYKQQVQHLVDKGIMFNHISQNAAEQYLATHNNFFKLMSYRKNYPKSDKTGKYIHMDFAHMIDLARIDTRLRVLMLEMCLNIEHFSKVELLDMVTNTKREDGYTVVSDYKRSLNCEQLKVLNSEISRCGNNPYLSSLYSKYHNCIPIWVFLEMISFSQFIHFYGYCAKRFNSISMEDKKYMLLSIRKIRNAAAHNTCLINDVNPATLPYNASYVFMRALSSAGINQKQRSKRIRSEQIYLIALCLYLHKKLHSQSWNKQINCREAKCV